MYKLGSIWSVVSAEVVAATLGVANTWLFLKIGKMVPSELEVYANTVALTLGVVWLFFSTSIWLRTDEESKNVSKAIASGGREMFLDEASKRVSPVIWLLYYQISLFTLLGFDLFHIASGAELVAGVINFLISMLIVLTVVLLKDSDDSLSGIVFVSNVSEIASEWWGLLNGRFKRS